MALLLPDPCDENCPEDFKGQARKILLGMDGRPQGWPKSVASDEGLRRVVLRFIADFTNWDNAAKPAYLDVGRALVTAAHPNETPLVWSTPSQVAAQSLWKPHPGYGSPLAQLPG